MMIPRIHHRCRQVVKVFHVTGSQYCAMSNGDTGNEGITDVHGAATAFTQRRYLGRTIRRTDIKYNNAVGQINLHQLFKTILQ